MNILVFKLENSIWTFCIWYTKARCSTHIMASSIWLQNVEYHWQCNVWFVQTDCQLWWRMRSQILTNYFIFRMAYDVRQRIWFIHSFWLNFHLFLLVFSLLFVSSPPSMSAAFFCCWRFAFPNRKFNAILFVIVISCKGLCFHFSIQCC